MFLFLSFWGVLLWEVRGKVELEGPHLPSPSPFSVSRCSDFDVYLLLYFERFRVC